MKTTEKSGEQISALADGELSEAEIDSIISGLRDPSAKSDWELYHQIGDVLRSDDMAVAFSPEFATRMMARLDAEPTIVMPAAAIISHAKELECHQNRPDKIVEQRRWALPSMLAAAAVATVAFVATPQLMVGILGEGAETRNITASQAEKSEPVLAESSAKQGQTSVVAASAPEGIVYRDARIDDYLMAHQRFSPSVYNSAQYTRSATLTNDSSK